MKGYEDMDSNREAEKQQLIDALIRINEAIRSNRIIAKVSGIMCLLILIFLIFYHSLFIFLGTVGIAAILFIPSIVSLSSLYKKRDNINRKLDDYEEDL